MNELAAADIAAVGLGLLTTLERIVFAGVCALVVTVVFGVCRLCAACGSDMKRALMAAIIVALTAAWPAAQSANDLFQKALSKERAEGRLDEAIQMYERIVKEFATDRPLAAKALLQMAGCYDRLGKTEARRIYERVARDYPEQKEAVAVAQAHLSVLAATAESGSAAVSRRLWTGNTAEPASGSTDGRLVVFTVWPTGNLAAIELGTGRQRPLTQKRESDGHNFAQFPVISPDGKLVAYSWHLLEKNVYELRVIAAAGGSEPRTLYSNEEVPVIAAAGWSADGKQLLVTCWRRDGPSQVALLSADGGALRVVKSFNGQMLRRLSLSPDGRYIAYDFPQEEGRPERDIALLASDGSREIQLVRHPGHDAGPMWTPDGQRVLFFSDRNGALGLWGVSLVDGRPKGVPALLQANVGGALPLGFSRKGGFHYSVPGGANDLLIADMDLETGRLLSEPVAVASRYGRATQGPAWSRDGSQLAYAVSTSPLARVGPLRIVARDMQTGQEREMSQSFRTIGSAPKWRPDGKALLAAGLPAESLVGALVFDVADGSARTLAGSLKWDQCGYPQWSITGDAVLCQVGKEEIVWRNVVSGEEMRRVRFERVSANVPLSPDGRWLAFVGKDLRTLNLVATEGGEPREVFRLDGNADRLIPLSWTPDSRFLLCRTEQGQLWRVPVSGGDARQLSMPVKGLRSLSVHPDGKRVAMLVPEPGSAIWVLENFLPPPSAATSARRPAAKR